MARSGKGPFGGDLDQPVTIRRASATADGMGGVTETWADVATAWARIEAIGGSESWETMRLTGHGRYRAILRWRGDADGQPAYRAADKLVWHGREYGIEVVVPVGPRRTWIELALVEGEPS